MARDGGSTRLRGVVAVFKFHRLSQMVDGQLYMMYRYRHKSESARSAIYALLIGGAAMPRGVAL